MTRRKMINLRMLRKTRDKSKTKLKREASQGRRKRSMRAERTTRRSLKFNNQRRAVLKSQQQNRLARLPKDLAQLQE